MMIGGLAMYGGAKLDELTNKQGEEKTSKQSKNNEKEERDYILRKARENVGVPLMGEGRHEFKNSNERTDKKRKGSLGAGARAGMAASIFMQGMTGNLGDPEALKKLIKGVGDIAGNEKNTQGDVFYNVMSNNIQQQKDKGYDLFKEGIENLVGQLQEVSLSSEAGSMNEGARMNAYNMNNISSEVRLKNSQNYYQRPLNTESGDISNNYVKELKNLNRNNIQRILESYTDFGNIEEMIRNSMEEQRNLE